MDAKRIGNDTAAQLALADAAYTVVEMGRTESTQEYLMRQHGEAISDTALLHAAPSTSVPKLDDLRRLSEQIRNDRRLKPPGFK